MSGPRCSVCSHEARSVIDKLLATGANSARAIARQYGLSKDAVRRHGDAHIVKAVARVMRRRAERHEDEVTDLFSARLETAHAAATRALERAECEPDGWKYAAPLIGQLFRGVELLGRASGRLDGARRETIRVNALVLMPTPTARAVAAPTIELKPLEPPDSE